jgi:alpha-2-macroglobulin
MPKDRVGGMAIAAILTLAILPGASQTPALTILSASPTGELSQLADAGQIRVIFSEPMVALGSVTNGAAPPWIHITPAVTGSFFWSGTKTLIFSPNASVPLPYATRFSLHVDASATSNAGHTLGAPFDLTFTTPTVRLLSAEWYRQTARFDSPAVIALQFNQPVRPEDVAAHARVALAPHPWTPPVLLADARERWRQDDPQGLAGFDDKVAAVRRVTTMTDAVGVRVAASWNEVRFPRAPERVVLETTIAPPPEGRLEITIGDTMPSPGGPERHAAQSAFVQLERAFFVIGAQCTIWCDSTSRNGIQMTMPVALSAMPSALAVTDVTDAARERPIAARPVSADAAAQVTPYPALADLGFPGQPPVTTWRLRLDAKLTAADGQTLGYPWVGFVETVYSQPFAALDGTLWEAGAGPVVPVHARNVASLTQWIAPIELTSVMPRLRALQGPSPSLPPVERETRPLTFTPETVQVHGLDLRRLLSPGGTGIVWAAVAPGEVQPRSVPANGSRPRSTLLQVTNLGISFKESPQSTLVFVTRLDTGAPVPDARVSIVDTANVTQWRGTTDRDGVSLAPALALRGTRSRWDLSFLVTAEKEGDVAFLGSNSSVNASPPGGHTSYGLDESKAVLRGSLFTDRGAYKETEEVHIKAIVRDDTPGGMRLVPEGSGLDVALVDDRGHEVDHRKVVVSAWSSAEWTWRVPEGAALGRYRIQMTRAGTQRSERTPVIGGDFLVAAFRRPDFRVDATLTADPAVLGSTLRATVEAKYLFGGALDSRPARWWFRRTPVREPPAAVRQRYPEARYAVGYLPGYDAAPPADPQLPDGTGMLGADGRTTVALPTPADRDVANSYTFETDVEDVSGQHIANRAALVVHPASLYVAMSRLPMFVDTKAKTSVVVVAVDLSGTPVAGTTVTVSLVREQWVAGPPDRWRQIGWQRRESPAGEWTVRTAAGETPLSIPLSEGGRYILRAIARDGNGRQTRTELDFYALGPGATSWQSDGTLIELTPERETWKPGETARILIHSPWPRATGLVTVEREGIRSHRSVTITSTQDTVDVPITEADIPNVYVSVMLVKGRTSTDPTMDDGGPAFRVGYTELTVDDASKRLRVEVSADRDEYRPGQPATVSVAVTDHRGAPAASEVTLWAMDRGLLSLTNYTTPDVLKAIYEPKALQVNTGDNRHLLMRRRPLDVSSGVAGGVLGGVVGGLPEVQTSRAEMVRVSAELPSAPPPGAEVRQDFRPLVFWLGSAATGPDGRATTTVTLPDSLTTYRIIAVAGDRASQFGFAEREIRATKPLTLLPAFPRFLSKGDRALFGAVVTNGRKEAGNAVVTIQSLDADSLRFGNVATRTVRLAPGASEAVRFDALARAPGSPRVRMTVTLGADTDTFESPLVVSDPLRPETTAAYGDTIGTATETLALPAGVLPGAGGLTVDLSSTALVGLGEAARYLQEYPYGCAEQKASRALALLLSSDLGGAFSLAGTNAAQSRAQGIKALSALAAFQCDGGGFSLWPGQCGAESAYLTAYVLHVMKVAGTLRVPLNSGVIDKALDYLEQEVKATPPDPMWWPVWAASHAYSVKVLAEFGRKPSTEIARLAGLAERLPIFALSYLADALAASNDRGPRYREVIRRLTNALRLDADRAHVEEIDDDGLAWVWSSNVRATAVVMDGFSRRGDNAPLVAPLVRWLVAARTNGRWSTTHENAMALEALVAYYRAFEGGIPRMTTTVAVGAATIGTASFAGRSTTAQQLQVPMQDLLQHVATAPALTITRTGTGRVYYTARLQSFAPEAPAAVDRGFQVERRYAAYIKDGTSPATLSFTAGDVVRVTVAVTIRGEGRYLALTDPVPAGFEPIDGWFETTARDLADQATNDPDEWQRGTFDYIEKHDDRVFAFATRLGSGRHEFTYLVRATTAGTFHASGARVEAMYAPELGGRSEAATVTVK